jgi:hypothetical protein
MENSPVSFDSSPPDDPFTALFEAVGYRSVPDNKGRYIQGMLRLAHDDLAALAFMRDPQIIRLFANAGLRKGRAYTYREMLGIAQPGSDDKRQRLNQQMHRMLAQSILLRGYNIRCPNCDLEIWYDLESMTSWHGLCQGCRSPVAISLEPHIAYRLNQLFIAGLKNGALTVLLTALWLKGDSDDPLTWRAGYVVDKDGQKTDIDLIARSGETLTFAECKDNFASDEAGVNTLITQLERNLTVACDIGADRFMFATLIHEVPQQVIDFLDKVEDIETRLLLSGNLITDADQPL